MDSRFRQAKCVNSQLNIEEVTTWWINSFSSSSSIESSNEKKIFLFIFHCTNDSFTGFCKLDPPSRCSKLLTFKNVRSIWDRFKIIATLLCKIEKKLLFFSIFSVALSSSLPLILRSPKIFWFLSYFVTFYLYSQINFVGIFFQNNWDCGISCNQ